MDCGQCQQFMPDVLKRRIVQFNSDVSQWNVANTTNLNYVVGLLVIVH
jgi:hypothetical protein